MSDWPTHKTVILAVTVKAADADTIRRLVLDALDDGPPCVCRSGSRPANVGEHGDFDAIYPPTDDTEPRG